MPEPAPASKNRLVSAFRRNRLALVGAGMVIGLLFVAIAAPWLAPTDPAVQSVQTRFTPPGGANLLGSDFYGRDILSRLIHASRVSLMVGALSVGIGLVLGVTLGMIAGYVRGRIETIIMRATDVMMSFPDEVFGIMIMVAIGTGLTNLIVAIGLLMTPRFVRLAHGPTLALTGRDFVTAAEALGVRRRGILARHLLPNVMGELLVMASLWMGTAIRLEANLSFLGLGVSPPTPTWGNMIRAGLDYLSSAWWVAVFPGIAILLTVLAFNLLGDGIRDVADPHLTT
jgi:peptide/nickel transport system permease protein